MSDINGAERSRSISVFLTRIGRLIRSQVAVGAAIALAVGSMIAPHRASADPLVVISITGGSPQTICDTANPLDCIEVTEADLILCNPTSFGGSGEITGCDWSILFDGDDVGVNDDDEINLQMRALEIASNGSLIFVMAGSDQVPGGLVLKNNDINVFTAVDVLKPYVGGGPYTTADGAIKKYLDGELTQVDVAAKPWDALELLSQNQCEANIDATEDEDRTCPIIGSLTAGGTPTNFGIRFNNEDLIRCVPTGWAGNGAVEACSYSVMLDSSAINGGGTFGITSDIEAIDFLSFNLTTLNGEMVFQKKAGSPDGFPAHEPGRDLLLYDGSFGSGECDPSGAACAGDDDCPGSETCNTGTCSLTPDPCATDEDCTGPGNDCVHTRPYTGTVTLFFDGSAVGLTGTGQKLEAFSIVPDIDDDDLPDGVDNCPNVDNPPSVCSGGVATCPTGLSSECPPGEQCVQPDSDGDGVGDPCDQCNGRDDDICECGDSILDRPSEDCDLGTENGPDGPCDDNCQISGTCTISGTPCTSADECPDGEGCCGDTVEDPGEQCDDGNTIEDDACTGECLDNPAGVPILGCEDVTGPHIVPAFVKITKFKDTKDQPDIDRWKTKGDFNLVAGVLIDPANDPVTIIYNNNLTGMLFTSTLPAGNFSATSTNPARPKFKFFDKEADVPGAASWRKGKFSQKSSLPSGGQPGNKVKFLLDGRSVSLFSVAELGPLTLRETIRIGDVCATAILNCVAKGNNTTFKCASTGAP